MEFLAQYGMFLLKAVTLVVAILFVFGSVLAMSRKTKSRLEFVPMNKSFEEIRAQLEKLLPGKKKTKAKKKRKKQKDFKHTVFVIDFYGDVKASQVEELREAINAVLLVAKKSDEVVVRLESSGGIVNAYGLAASQLIRLKEKQIPLTVCVDKVAASGGYLMACVADRILAAPFAIIGSIGVMSQFPNFHRWLKKHNIDVELLTAGEYKRTLTLFTENSSKARQKFQEDLEQIHHAFKQSILAQRSTLDIETVATGEHWLAQDAMNLALVDELQTSDDYLQAKLESAQLLHIQVHHKPSVVEKILKPATSLLHPWG